MAVVKTFPKISTLYSNLFPKCIFRGWWSWMLIKTITNSYIWMREVLIWPRQGGEVGISLASGQPSKYLDNVGASITMCAAISEDGVVGRRPHIGPYNAAFLVTFLDELDQVYRAEGGTYVIVWDNVRFHHAHVVASMFQAHCAIYHPCIYPHTLPSLNPIEEFSRMEMEGSW